MRLIQIEVGQMQNFNYVVGCESTGRAAWVDPAWEVERILDEAARASLKVTNLLVTHTHPDHIEGLGRAQRATGATVQVHALEAGRARAVLEPSAALRGLVDGDTVEIGEIQIRAMHTPGHTPGAICYLIPSQRTVPAAVITGDTLFVGRCGRTDFAGSDPKAMYWSLRKLASLPDETVVYPGHNYADHPTSTIGREKTHNVHMSAPDLREFLRRRMGEEYLARLPTRPREEQG